MAGVVCQEARVVLGSSKRSLKMVMCVMVYAWGPVYMYAVLDGLPKLCILKP